MDRVKIRGFDLPHDMAICDVLKEGNKTVQQGVRLSMTYLWRSCKEGSVDVVDELIVRSTIDSRTNKKCVCGAEKARTTHAKWCDVYEE